MLIGKTELSFPAFRIIFCTAISSKHSIKFRLAAAPCMVFPENFLIFSITSV
jgi:hypothetical protein